MIPFLRGTIAALFVDSVVIEVGGIGYRVSMSGKSLSRLGHVGEEVKVLTRLQVRDDALVLYGFLNHDEERLFAKLTSVSSVGPKVALSALSTYEPETLVSAIVSQDVGAIQQIPGVGKKMASRIALELKESFGSEAQIALPGISTQAANGFHFGRNRSCTQGGSRGSKRNDTIAIRLKAFREIIDKRWTHLCLTILK